MSPATIVRRRTKTKQGLYHSAVFNALEKAREKMNGQAQVKFMCPICRGGAFAYSRQFNMGHDYVARCNGGCFEVWE